MAATHRVLLSRAFSALATYPDEASALGIKGSEVTSLRIQLVSFWVILVTVCVSLAVITAALARHTANAQVETVQRVAEQACESISARYAKSIADRGAEAPQLDLLQVLLQLVLIEVPHVEGGVWTASGGFLAYAYPTYEGSGVKRDVPDAEKAHIAEIAGITARKQALQTDVVRASREALVLSACPLESPHHDLIAWTMTRSSLAALDAERSTRITLGVLLGFVLVSGLWLGAILLRGYRHVRRLEDQLAGGGDDDPSTPLAGTGVTELDRIVTALNLYRGRLDQSRRTLQDNERHRARDQRLSALGRMTGSVAHEIRNPIAAMRLKAENALAGPVDRQPAALQAILGQIARLDGLVQSLLAVVQPINLSLRKIDLAAWLQQHVDDFMDKARTRGLRIDVDAAVTVAEIDETHLGRAVDNLFDNALRHARSTVHVSLTRGVRTAVIVVEDDGSGVPADMRDAMFEPFASGRHNGTGLGLALAREVALAHGGDLRHVASALGGARFELEFPWHDFSS